jgi:hypothetical protein
MVGQGAQEKIAPFLQEVNIKMDSNKYPHH